MNAFVSIPFTAEKHQGFSEVNGIAKFSAAGVIFEFESKLFGLISNGFSEVRLPIGEILDVKFKKLMFKRGAKITLRAVSMAAMAELPNEAGKMVLKIANDDVERAQRAIEVLQQDLAGRPDELPPNHTPVSVLFDESEDETRKLQ